ncbi:hypothetical protein OG1X_0505 [Enterococcus faecalis OG1X]|nr:hypothetical protein OG1X_0505 [Enterococcus faecalis OG1X]
MRLIAREADPRAGRPPPIETANHTLWPAAAPPRATPKGTTHP